MSPARLEFWIFIAAAYLVLTPLSCAFWRQRMMAVINLVVLGRLLGPGAWLSLLLLFAALYGSFRMVGQKSVPRGRFLLFICWFIASWASWAWMDGSKVLLLGLNYTLLRLCYLARAIWEGTKAPTIFELVNYLCPFFMLLAGPIQSYKEFLNCDQGGGTQAELFLQGAERISSGLVKKFFLAEALRRVFLTGFSHPDPLYFFAEVQFNFLCLYYDFSGYSDIAVGVGLLLGWKTPENFARPLASRHLIEFWERWHMSLSRFIRSEIFLPLQYSLLRGGLMGRPLLAAGLSFVFSFLLCGLWHQLQLKFLVWGLFHGLGLWVCKWYQNVLKRRLSSARRKSLAAHRGVKAFSVFLTFEFVAWSWYLVTVPVDSPWRWW